MTREKYFRAFFAARSSDPSALLVYFLSPAPDTQVAASEPEPLTKVEEKYVNLISLLFARSFA
jgi:hypothetical protein